VQLTVLRYRDTFSICFHIFSIFRPTSKVLYTIQIYINTQIFKCSESLLVCSEFLNY
jgi:hypothetical protein